MCIATANAAELNVKPPREVGVRWRMGDYGALEPTTEVIRLGNRGELDKIVRQYGDKRERDRNGYTVLKRDREGKWSAQVYVLSGATEKAALEHEMNHVRGFIHD